mmetsp:Transcript_13815/g.29506  ORF Transcript_13815/g.29506 Transcript_13815/m.29506 type:complete len:353 (-) Transcript_13815:524-1582(-)
MTSEASLPNDNIVLVDIVQYVFATTGHFKYFTSLRFPSSDLVRSCILGIDRGNITYPLGLRVRPGLLRLFLLQLQRHLPQVGCRFGRSGGRLLGLQVALLQVLVKVKVAIGPSLVEGAFPLTIFGDAVNSDGASEAFLETWILNEKGRDAKAFVGTILGDLKVAELEQRLEDELLAVGHDAEVLELLLEVGNSLAGEGVGEVLLLVGDGIVPAPELGGTEEGFAEHLANVHLGVFRIDNEGAFLPLDEEVEVGGELELGQVDAEGWSHLAAEPLDGDDVDGGYAKTEDHAILDCFGRDAELNPTDGLSFDANATPGELGNFQKGHGIVRLDDLGIVEDDIPAVAGTRGYLAG